MPSVFISCFALLDSLYSTGSVIKLKMIEKEKNPQYMSYLANKLVIDKLFAFLKDIFDTVIVITVIIEPILFEVIFLVLPKGRRIR